MILKSVAYVMFATGGWLLVKCLPFDVSEFWQIVSFAVALFGSFLIDLYFRVNLNRDQVSQKRAKVLPPKDVKMKSLEDLLYLEEMEAINSTFGHSKVYCKVGSTTDIVKTPYSVVYSLTKARNEKLSKVKAAIPDIAVELFKKRTKFGLLESVKPLLVEPQLDLVLPRTEPRPLLFTERSLDLSEFDVVLGRTYVGKHSVQVTINLESPLTFSQLVGGTSGSGKTNLLFSMILSSCYVTSPEALNIAFIDIGNKNFSSFKQLPHTVSFASTVEGALRLLKSVESQMNGPEGLYKARVWIVIDEIQKITDSVEDGTIKREFVRLLSLIASNGRAYGFSLLIATQHPNHRVIDTQVRHNLQVRVAGIVKDQGQSETILGSGIYSALDLSQIGSFFMVTNTDTKLIYSYLVKDFEKEIENIKTLFESLAVKEFDNFKKQPVDIPPLVLEVFKKYDDGKKLNRGWLTNSVNALAETLGTSPKGSNFEKYSETVKKLKKEYLKNK